MFTGIFTCMFTSMLKYIFMFVFKIMHVHNIWMLKELTNEARHVRQMFASMFTGVFFYMWVYTCVPIYCKQILDLWLEKIIFSLSKNIIQIIPKAIKKRHKYLIFCFRKRYGHTLMKFLLLQVILYFLFRMEITCVGWFWFTNKKNVHILKVHRKYRGSLCYQTISLKQISRSGSYSA